LIQNIQEILKTWHEVFKDEEKQYSEFEPSDIEYFVGCMLYNKFNFKYSVDTMSTIDLSYDFLLAVEDSYDEVKSKIDSISIEDEAQKLDAMIAFLDDSKKKYTQDELYLLNRLSYHIGGIKERFDTEVEVAKVEFILPKARSANPLLR